MAPQSRILPGKSHGWRSLVGCGPWGHKESDTTKRLHFHFSLSCIGEGNGNPLQCSCLENPRDRGAWWAAVYGVAQSWTQLKRLSSSSRKGIQLQNSGVHLLKILARYLKMSTVPERAVTTFSKCSLCHIHLKSHILTLWCFSAAFGIYKIRYLILH